MAKGKNWPFPIIKYCNRVGGSRRRCETKRGKTKRTRDAAALDRLKVQQDVHKAALSETGEDIAEREKAIEVNECGILEKQEVITRAAAKPISDRQQEHKLIEAAAQAFNLSLLDDLKPGLHRQVSRGA